MTQRLMLMNGLCSSEPDPSQRQDCSAASRAQSQGPQTVVHKAQPVGLGQMAWGSGQEAKPSRRAESIRSWGSRQDCHPSLGIWA